MITDIYDGCFDAGIHIFSHSINIDDTWSPVKKYLEQQGFPPEKYCHEKYDEELLKNIMDEQKAVISFQKAKGHKTLFQMMIIFDAISSIQTSSKSELSSQFFGRLKFASKLR